MDKQIGDAETEQSAVEGVILNSLIETKHHLFYPQIRATKSEWREVGDSKLKRLHYRRSAMKKGSASEPLL